MSILEKINSFRKKARRVNDVSSALTQGVSGIASIFTGQVRNDTFIETGLPNVERMKANLERGVARANKFAVYITPPRMLAGSNASYLLFRTQATELPGQTLDVIQHRPMGFGNARQMPTGYNPFPPVGVEFILSGDYREYKYLSSWFDGIVKKSDGRSENQGGTHLVNFHENYACQMAIVAYNELGDVTYECFFKDAYPTQLDPVSLNWALNDQINAVRAQFSYTAWYDRTVRDSSDSKFPNILTGIDARIGAQINGAPETGFKAFGVEDKLPSGVRDAIDVITAGGFLQF
jgi:hypothetical protein